jgi:hypothetical protein
MRLLIFFISFGLFFTVQAQDCNKVSKKMVKRLQLDISTLADDQMEGRQSGTTGEIKARDYIVTRMKEIGIEAGGTSSYLQSFPFNENVKQKANSTRLSLNGTSLKLNHEFYPINLSSNGRLDDIPVIWVSYGLHVPEVGYSDYDRLEADVNGYIALMDIANPEGLSSEPDLLTKAIEALDRGALALLLYKSKSSVEIPESKFKEIKALGIPVVFIKNKAFKKVPRDFVENASLSVSQYEVLKKGYNVLAYLDNDADKTVIIGAHYDHLGWGIDGSLHKGPRKIHNGADDNASGTAALLELAYFLKKNKIKENNNYLFIAFSGEEMGLLGSQYFVANPSIDLSDINYMLNMDMLGRMEEGMDLSVNGTGSCSLWKESLNEVACDAFALTMKPKGFGPSDHAPFYLNGIPALHFWTGEHNDYHKPSDDVEKINFEAESQIISFIESFILLMDAKGEVDFQFTE